MADVAVEKNETPVVEKVADVDAAAAKKDAVVAATDATDNGAAETPETKENGSAVAIESNTADEADTPAAVDAAVAAAADKSADETAVPEENGEKVAVEADANGSDASPAEAVKRKAASETAETKVDESVGVATPEKKAKLDEPAAPKEDVQNGSEATEVAA